MKKFYVGLQQWDLLSIVQWWFNNNLLKMCLFCTWRCPMKGEGAEETNRLSVKMPVSTLLNSRRVWSPAIWPEYEKVGAQKDTVNRCEIMWFEFFIFKTDIKGRDSSVCCKGASIRYCKISHLFPRVDGSRQDCNTLSCNTHLVFLWPISSHTSNTVIAPVYIS